MNHVALSQSQPPCFTVKARVRLQVRIDYYFDPSFSSTAQISHKTVSLILREAFF